MKLRVNNNTHLPILAVGLLSRVFIPFVAVVDARCRGLDYHLWNADTDTELEYWTPSQGDELCAESWEYSIMVDPFFCDQPVESARMQLWGPNGDEYEKGMEPIQITKESYSPFMLFANVGKPWVLGNFTIQAQLYNQKWQQGDLVDKIKVD
jgi:hypothetical protein